MFAQFIDALMWVCQAAARFPQQWLAGRPLLGDGDGPGDCLLAKLLGTGSQRETLAQVAHLFWREFRLVEHPADGLRFFEVLPPRIGAVHDNDHKDTYRQRCNYERKTRFAAGRGNGNAALIPEATKANQCGKNAIFMEMEIN